jgi:hypothetical protein
MEQVKRICVKARLVAKKDEGAYTQYVFQDMITLSYIMCTRCPNWQTNEVNLLEDGFLEYHEVRGGIDTYFDAVMQIRKTYQDTATYFLNFVPITKVLKDGYVVDKNELLVK